MKSSAKIYIFRYKRGLNYLIGEFSQLVEGRKGCNEEHSVCNTPLRIADMWGFIG